MSQKNNYYLRIVSLFFIFFCPLVVLASPLTTKFDSNTNQFSDAAGFQVTTGDSQFVAVINTAVSGFLGLLGIVFIILLLTAGYNYMTAEGDEGKVKTSIASIRRAVIGLIITVSAYSIAYFVFNNISANSSGYNIQAGQN